mgnify:FL=1
MNSSMTLYKRYINIVVETDKNGKMNPLFIRWDDGKLFKIDKVIEHKHAASQVGGNGLMYVVVIHGKKRRIFYEINRWFIESFSP